jgi:hypothetical protein
LESNGPVPENPMPGEVFEKNHSHACAMSVMKMMFIAYIAIQTNTKRIGRFLSKRDNVNG